MKHLPPYGSLDLRQPGLGLVENVYDEPVPTPDQAVHVLKILGEWTKRGWFYRPRLVETGVRIEYHNPGPPSPLNDILVSHGVNHFDALCQATTVMQVLLEEHPEKT